MNLEPLTWRQTVSRVKADYSRFATVIERQQGYRPCALVLHPSFVCVFLYRISNHLYRRRHRYLARFFWHLNFMLTGADISEPADLGEGLVVLSPAGTAVMAKSGCNLTLMPMAGLGSELGRREDIGAGPGIPVLGDGVLLEPHAGVLGPVHVGHRVRIAAVTCVTKDVPDGAIIAAPPAKIIRTFDQP